MKAIALLSLLLTLSAFASIDNQFIERDQKLLLETFTGLERTMGFYANRMKSIAKKVENSDTYILSVSENREVDSFWERFNDIRISLHTIYNTYKDVKSDDPRISLLRYGSLVGLIYPGAVIVKDLWKNERMRQILDGAANVQIPHGSYISMQNEVFYQEKNLREQSGENIEFLMLFPGYNVDREVERFSRNRNVLRLYRDQISTLILNSADLYHMRYQKIRPFFQSLKNLLVLKMRNAVYKFKDIFYKNFLKISTWIGDTKVHRVDHDYYNGTTLINIEDAKKLKIKLRTGDIMTSRSNWFLSNAFLPGFWPHSFIYLGTQKEFTDFFKDDAETNQFYKKKCVSEKKECNSFLGYLAKSSTTKEAWKNYPIKDDHGYENVLIEATSEGIHFSSLRHTFLNDYLGALRPRLSKLQLAQTIYTSFTHFGKEYDFYLDWATDDRIVCSELVSKSFKSDSSIMKQGVDFNYSIEQGMYVEQIMGRIAIPVVNIVKKAYDENVLGIRPSQMDFVAFLKGVRKTNNAVFTSEKEYYDSIKWPKWSFMQN